MNKPWLALLLLCLFGTSALGGPNAGGVLNAHDADLLMSATNGSISICSQGTVPTVCDQMDSRVDGAIDLATEKIWKVYATFPVGSSPRLMGIAWGIFYDASLVIAHYGKCGDFELNDDGWPASGQGSSVIWDSAQTGWITQVYWFGGYAYAPTIMELGPNPTQGGVFGDDSIPAILDPIMCYGGIGFDTNGHLCCPCCGDPGACCDPATGACVIMLESDCLPPNIWHPEWTSCDPNPCPPPLGVCCECTGSCTVTTPDECTGQDFTWHPGWLSCDPNPCPNPLFACCDPLTGVCTLLICPSQCLPPGIWHPEWSSCEPNPCPPPPTPVERQSWGRIKVTYRD